MAIKSGDKNGKNGDGGKKRARGRRNGRNGDGGSAAEELKRYREEWAKCGEDGDEGAFAERGIGNGDGGRPWRKALTNTGGRNGKAVRRESRLG